MIIINSLKLIFSFWKTGAPLSYIVPIVLLGATIIQLFLLCKLKKQWLVLAIFAGIAVLCQLSLWIVAAVMGRDAVGLALMGAMVITFSMTIVLGCALGLFIHRYIIHKFIPVLSERLCA